MNRFAMLPDSRAPLLVFLGVDASESHALFLVDASLSQSGEGSCGDDACSFVELRLGNERSFTDEHGRTYLLRLDQIRKVTVKKAAPRSSRSEAGERPAARTAGGVARPFLSPLLGDLVE